MTNSKKHINSLASKLREMNVPEEKIAEIVAHEELKASGYMGVTRYGRQVDRRDFPDAIPIQANRLLGFPKPKELKDE